MMVRERITRQGEWLGLNRAAAYTLYQPRAQITLRLKTEHANAQESLWHRNEEWATISLSLSLSSLFPLQTHTHTFHLFPLSKFLLTPPPLLPLPGHSSLFLRLNHPLWAFLLFHWFCYVYLLLHLWNWRHRPTSLLLFNNRSWAFSQPWAINVPDRNITSHQFQTTDRLVYCCCVLYWRRNFTHLRRGNCEWQQSTARLIFNKGTMELAQEWIYFLTDTGYCCPVPVPLAVSEPCIPTPLTLPKTLCLINRLSKCLAGTQAGPSEISPSHCPSSLF